ncbi:MAG: tRNA lysidine(34) synthetase TilS [Flavobacteriaceae bacterium]|nr:tRNA lysidine(34) synthetase TilS [Flavobacteriaceae bacterium]
MEKEFKKHIEANFPELLNQPYAIACSGGLDSVVLSYLMQQINPKGILLHCNFQLRGLESDADALFVQDLGKQLHVETYDRVFDTEAYKKQTGKNTQLAARDLRYNWFSTQLEEKKIACILTAHHADDNLETFLIELSRGGGLEGLSGIPERNQKFWRPLLPFSRKQLENYAKENKLQWREDSSNKESIYIRNRLRHDVVPHLKEIHPNFLENFKQTQRYIKQAKEMIQNHLQELDLVSKLDDHTLLIDIKKMEDYTPKSGYLYYLMAPYGFTNTNNLIRFLKAKTGAVITSETHRLLQDRGRWMLSKKVQEAQFEEYKIESLTNLGHLPIVITTSKDLEKDAVAIDASRLEFPLFLRKRKAGDVFYPSGMQGKKKLSKYFKDEKYTQFEKEAQWLLCTKDAVVWVVGKRLDKRFEAISKTSETIYLTKQ